MEGFLDIKAVSNITGYTIDEIRLLVSNGQIPNLSWPSGKVIFPTADIENWIKTHKKAVPAAAAPKGEAWVEESGPAGEKAKDEDPSGPPAKTPKPKEAKAPKGPKGAKSAKK